MDFNEFKTYSARWASHFYFRLHGRLVKASVKEICQENDNLMGEAHSGCMRAKFRYNVCNAAQHD